MTPTGVGLGLRAHFLSAVARGDAVGKIAFLEVSPENYMHRGGRNPRVFEEIAERHLILTHGLMLSLGSTDPFDLEYIKALRGFCARHGGQWHSDHLCFSGLGGVLLHDLLPLPPTRATAARVAGRIREAQDRIGKSMAIENISHYVAMGEPELREPEFLCEVLERADCKLLLDVNNVFVNSRNFGFDPWTWLASIPLERVVQMHVAGHEAWETFGMWVDSHGATVLPEVHAMMQWVIERTGPIPVVLERDTNVPPLADLLEEVASLQHSYELALERWKQVRGP